jgi:hypothetical protein
VNYYLFCEECPDIANEYECGWRGFHTDDEDEPTEVVILCPICAREFGSPIKRTRSEEN